MDLDYFLYHEVVVGTPPAERDWGPDWILGFKGEKEFPLAGNLILTLKRFLKYKQRKNNFKLIFFRDEMTHTV